MGTTYTQRMNLWAIDISGGGVRGFKRWDEFCEFTNVTGLEFCPKIRATRAFVIMSIMFGSFSALSLCFVANFRLRTMTSAFLSLGCTFLTFVTTTVAFSLGLYYPNSSLMSAPEMGFVSMSIGWAFAFVSTALLVASVFCGGKGDFARFQDEVACGASRRLSPMMKTSSGSSQPSKGSYVLDDTGKLKWQPTESSLTKESHETNENETKNELENQAKESVQCSSVEASGAKIEV